MKYNTLTSSLILSIMLAGTETIAMQADSHETERPHTTSLVLTQEDVLTQSRIQPDLAERVAEGFKDGASPQSHLDGMQAFKELSESALLRKKTNAPISQPVDPLTQKEEEAISWLGWFFTSRKNVEKNPEVPSSQAIWYNPFSWFGGGSTPVSSNTTTDTRADDWVDLNLLASLKQGDELKDNLSTSNALVSNITSSDETSEGVVFKWNQTGHSLKVEEIEGAITVKTDHNADANYQLESNRFLVSPGEKIRVPYKVSVNTGGKIAFGLLNTKRNNWYGTEHILGEGANEGIDEWIVPEGETETSLVVRNYHLGTPGQSTFTINALNIMKGKFYENVTFKWNQTLHPIKVEAVDGGTTIITDYNADATYQLESDRFPVNPGENIRVPYKVTVNTGGKVAFGLLSTKRNNWYGTEHILGEGANEGIDEWIVPEGETETSLVVRNYHLGIPGQSTFTINALNIMKK